MKVKQGVPKGKKKKNNLQSTLNKSIKKPKKHKIKKIIKNCEAAETVKKDYSESQESSGKRISLRQQLWNKYLLVFFENEKLNKKQKQIMEFCTNKSLTPPKRRRKFLNFIRNCFVHQADVTDEQCNELFDLILKKFVDYKAGTYYNSSSNEANSEGKAVTSKLGKNKKKKLLRNSESINKTDEQEWEKKSKKKKKNVNNDTEICNSKNMDTS